MERARVINTRVKTRARARVIEGDLIKTVFLGILMICIAATLNIGTYIQLYSEARNNDVLKNQLVELQKENSSLEEQKANSLNIREIQRKAEELGFVYNNSVNYVK